MWKAAIVAIQLQFVSIEWYTQQPHSDWMRLRLWFQSVSFGRLVRSIICAFICATIIPIRQYPCSSILFTICFSKRWSFCVFFINCFVNGRLFRNGSALILKYFICDSIESTPRQQLEFACKLLVNSHDYYSLYNFNQQLPMMMYDAVCLSTVPDQLLHFRVGIKIAGTFK